MTLSSSSSYETPGGAWRWSSQNSRREVRQRHSPVCGLQHDHDSLKRRQTHPHLHRMADMELPGCHHRSSLLSSFKIRTIPRQVPPFCYRSHRTVGHSVLLTKVKTSTRRRRADAQPLHFVTLNQRHSVDFPKPLLFLLLPSSSSPLL